MTKRQKTTHECEWADVEFNAIKNCHLWFDSEWIGIPFNEASYEQVVAAGLSDIQHSRINRKEWHSTMTCFDGLLRHKDTDTYKGVQVKHHQRPISANDLGSFYQGCLQLTKYSPEQPRPILLTTSGVTPHVKRAAEKDLFNFEIIYLDSTQFTNIAPEAMIVDQPTVFELRECQIQCLKKIEQSESVSPFVVGLPPGCGKTVIALKWSEQFNTVLIAAPTKNLVTELFARCQQHYGTTAQCIVFDSDTFTDSVQLSNRKIHTKQIVITTYASSHKVAEVFAHTDNLGVIIDEAHNMNSTTEILFNLTDNPLLLSGTHEGIDDEILDSIPNTNKFIMTMEDAENQGYVLPLRWIIPSGIETAITDSKESAEFLMTVLMRKGLGNCAAFFGTVNEAAAFAEVVSDIGLSHSKTANCRTITSVTPQKEREIIKQWVQDGNASEVRILASVRCCNEGVDIPGLQSVYIPSTGCDISTIQRICRANRVNGNKSEAVVILNTGGADMTSISSMMVGRTVRVTAVTPCIEQTDTDTEQTTATKAVLSVQQGVAGYLEWRYNYQIEIYRGYKERNEIIKRSTVYIDASSKKWNIGKFVNRQKEMFKIGKLSKTREQLCRELGMINDNMKTNSRPTPSADVRKLFQRAYDQHGIYYIANLQQKTVFDGQNIGCKCDPLRRKYIKGKLSQHDIEFYESIGMVWNYPSYSWYVQFEYWEAAKNQGSLKQNQKEYCKELQRDIHPWEWQHKQRRDRKTNKSSMTEEKVAKLNKGGFVW